MSPGHAAGGTAAGRITRVDGRPIGIDGVKYDLAINGIAGPGDRVVYTPKPAPDGTWSTKLSPGIYHAPQCTAHIPFNGETFVYTLVPTADLGDTDAEHGITADFVWHTTGPTDTFGNPPDPANHTNWRGGSCSLIWDRFYTDPANKVQNVAVPAGASFEFTATPKGKAIDGSDPKPIVWKRGFNSLLSCIVPDALNDLIPTEGGWRVTGREVLPDGTAKALQLKLSTATTYADAVDVRIGASASPAVTCDGPMLTVLGPHD